MELVNKVAQSGLITLDLEDFSRKKPSLHLISKFFRGLILVEFDALKAHDWCI